MLGCINILYWNLNAFDSAASFAGEVRDPGRTYPRAMLLCILLIVLSYIFPILVGALATDIPYASWTDGTFSDVARSIGGDWLAGWVVVCAAASNVGLFLAECSSDAFQLMGMAEVGMLPSFLGRKSRFGTPTVAILLSTFANLALAVTSTFAEIVTMTNFLYRYVRGLDLRVRFLLCKCSRIGGWVRLFFKSLDLEERLERERRSRRRDAEALNHVISHPPSLCLLFENAAWPSSSRSPPSSSCASSGQTCPGLTGSPSISSTPAS